MRKKSTGRSFPLRCCDDTPPTDGEAEELAREIDRRLCEAWGEIFSLAVLEWRDGQ